ncbi:MAG: hypothetical protein ACC652_12820, partial [Acidimicrobiales bacterium]
MKPLMLIIAFALFAAACGDSSGDLASSGGLSSAGVCEKAAQIDAFEPSLDSAGSLVDSFTEMNKILQEVVASAPDEIKDDVKLVADAFSSLVSDLAGADGDLAQIGELFTVLDTPEINAAGDRVSAYFEETCGLDSSGDDSSSAPAPAASSDDGDAGDESADNGDSDSSDSISALSGDIPEGVLDSLATTLGIEPASIQCLFDKSESLDADGLLENLAGPEAFQILEECNIDIGALAGAAEGLFGDSSEIDSTLDVSDDL